MEQKSPKLTSEIIQNKPSKLQKDCPKLMNFNNETIILATYKKDDKNYCGVVLVSQTHQIGKYSESWDALKFQDLDSDITINFKQPS